MVQNFATSELTQLGQLRVESALWDRTLSLPLKFFRGYSSGDMVTRLTVVDQPQDSAGVRRRSLRSWERSSIVNFFLLITYSWQPAIVAFLIVVVTGFAIVKLLHLRHSGPHVGAIRCSARSERVGGPAITGIGKVRVAGGRSLHRADDETSKPR